MVGAPVVEHVIEVLLSVDLVPRHRLVAGLAHFYKELIKLFATIPVYMDSVDELALIEELNARHALGGYQNWRLCELGSICVEPCSDLSIAVKKHKSVKRVKK